MGRDDIYFAVNHDDGLLVSNAIGFGGIGWLEWNHLHRQLLKHEDSRRAEFSTDARKPTGNPPSPSQG
jgi:hypothetical protein